MKKGILGYLVVGLVAGFVLVPAAQAAQTANVNVTVTIQNLSVTATGPIAFGTVVAGTSTVSTTSSTVTNDGNVNETYSLNLTDPVAWTFATAAPGAEEYGLLAVFNTLAPVAGDFNYTDHGLTDTPVSCSGTQFAGTQSGVSLAPTTATNLWFRFDAPSSTTATTQQTIVVTITAAAG